MLAGIGAAGALGVGAKTLPGLLGSRPQYTHYTYAAPDGAVRVAWYETYNDRVVEATAGADADDPTVVLDPDERPLYVPDATGPVLSIENVLPGDSGTIVLGVAVDDDAFASRVRVFPQLTANEENGRTEPERAAGDRTAATGELGDAVGLTVWRDGSSMSGCDGIVGVGDETVVEDSLRGVSDDFGTSGVDLGCLDPGAARCLGFAWRFDGGNGVQGDSVTFDLVVEAVDCSTEELEVVA